MPEETRNATKLAQLRWRMMHPVALLQPVVYLHSRVFVGVLVGSDRIQCMLVYVTNSTVARGCC